MTLVSLLLEDNAMTTQHLAGYTFEGGFPTPETIQKAYDDADLERAIHAYRRFYRAVAVAATWRGNAALAPSSDTPHEAILLDLRRAPIVVDVPPGPLAGAVDALDGRRVLDLDGRGGLHLIVPPDFRGTLPGGFHVGRSETFRALLVLRAIPPHGTPALLGRVALRALDGAAPVAATRIDPAHLAAPHETTLEYWRVLHELVETEPAYRDALGELAPLGIAKGKPFRPDRRMQLILERAAKVGSAQVRVQSFADRGGERRAWPDRRWERHAPEAGAYTWLGLRDRDGAYLDGGRTYALAVPLPVPAALCWSVTVHDPLTRAEIRTPQRRAALRSQVELVGELGDGAVELYFGPTPPAGCERRWLQTLPGRGWFSYVRIYGPEPAAFDGRWKLGDFQAL